MTLGGIIGSLTGKLVDLAVDVVGGPLGVAWNLKEKLKELQSHLLYIQAVLEDAEEQQRVNKAVRAWLHALKEVAYEADNLLDDVGHEILRKKALKEVGKVPSFLHVLNLFSSHNRFVFGVNIGWKLNDVLKRIDKIASEAKEFDLKVGSQPETSVANETCSFVKESDVVGRAAEKHQIVEMLVGNLGHNMNVLVLAIFGMGGIGKTTLAQLVYNDPRVVNHFQLRAWIWVSDVWSKEKIIENIIDQVKQRERKNSRGLQEANDDNSKRKMKTLEEKQIYLRELLSGKRYLIVLDDVWNEEPRKWKTLKDIMDSTGDKGSAILVTSRSKRVSEIMSAAKSYNLSYLSEDDSWTLFSSRAFAPGVERPEELVEIGKDIANKCGQLPLALDMIGRLLFVKSDVRDWLMIKNSSSIWNLETEIPPALWLSYKHLPPLSKRCFAFCTVFPKDHVMNKDTLIQMWMAHGLIPSSSDGKTLEDKGREIFNQLVQRSFLHHINEERYFWDRIITTCRMHDLVHDLGESIVGNECMALTEEESPEVTAPKDIYHLSISSVEKKMWKSSSEILRSLLIEYVRGTEIPPHTSLRVLQLRHCIKPPSSLDHLRHLRYLDLSYSDHIRELPESICTLFHLQTLNLSGCQCLFRLPESICTLFHLQTLDLCGCDRLLKLPERMGRMNGLRHLHLERCNALKGMPSGMGQLTNLQTLTKYIVGDEAQGNGGIGELKALPLSFKFELHNMRQVKDARQAIEANLHSKYIHHLELYYPSSSFHGIFQGEINNEGDGPDQVLEVLTPPGTLKVLKIMYYSGLKSFNPGWIEELKQLVELEFYACRECHRLPPFWRLTSLEQLRLSEMNSLKYIIFEDDDGDDDANAPSTALPAFPKLKELQLYGLHRLEGWWEKRNFATGMTNNCFPALKSLRIQMTELFPPSPVCLGLWTSMASLETLFISNCTTLVDLPEILQGLGSLRSLSIYGCENVTGKSSTIANPCLPPHLEELVFSDCESLTTMLRYPASLKSLEISDCPIRTLAAGNQGISHLTSLERITLGNCFRLEVSDSLMEALRGLPALQERKFSNCGFMFKSASPPSISWKMLS